MFNPGNGSTETVVCTADIDAIETAAAEEVWRIMESGCGHLIRTPTEHLMRTFSDSDSTASNILFTPPSSSVNQPLQLPGLKV
ncbi:hypothetical protein VitviT2T_021538 [Vitis vinifera]|uniref:Uncharacterized protein n=1 Tax=Vitis vinifera TaxID=29760 RepID=A0ABY9D799_VITVI|nr:hypothetical protein VitviT2T_021538 [Vitis vinifera]